MSFYVYVMGFFLLKVGPPPPWKNFLDPRLYSYVDFTSLPSMLEIDALLRW